MPKLSDGYEQTKRTNNNPKQNFNCHQSYPKSSRPHITVRINQAPAVGIAELRQSHCIFAGKPKLTVVFRFTSEQACWLRIDSGIRNRSAAATTNCVFPIQAFANY